MIKRIIATLTICLIITGLISPVFSNASAVPQPNWTDPGISEIINISDLTGWMLNGGTFDVSTYTDSESFMNDYFYGRTSTRLVDGNDLYYSQFGIGQDLYNIGSQSYNSRLDTVRLMSSSFREHSGYGRRFSEQANKTLLDSGNLYDMKIPLLNEVEFANFVGYNHDALKLYSDFFNSDEPDQPASNLPAEYSEYASIGNSIFSDRDILNSIYSYNSDGSTIMTKVNWENIYFKITNYNSGNLDGMSYQFFTNGRIDINSEGSTYRLYYSGGEAIPYLNLNGYKYNSLNSVRIRDPYLVPYSGGTYSSSSSGYNTPFTTIEQALSYTRSNFKHIDVYVDGVLWISSGNPTVTPTITPEFPDAIGGEELPTSTWQIYRPRAPYYTSVPGMLQAIDDAIQGDGKLDIDDLKPYLTDVNGDPVPDPVFDPEPVPIPVPDPVNPDVVPQLPELPVMPLDMPGFNGVSVLAEIINFTNQSLPNALIVTFWGIVFGIVILGLIKILHK